MTDLLLRQVNALGMDLTLFQYKGVSGSLAEGDDWATMYSIESANEGRGECQECLLLLKEHYEAQGKRFGSSVALNPRMRHILQKLDIYECSDGDRDPA